MIWWENVTKVFKSDLLSKPVTALDGVSFHAPQGSMTGYLGANGAGKTTSIKIALGFTSATSGHVRFASHMGVGRNILSKVGFLPERPYFYPNLTGMDFALFMGRLSGLSRTDVFTRARALAEKLRLDQAMNRELRTYSKGMLQRIGFLVAVQHGPELIILDEPLSGLDPIGRKELKDFIVEVHKEGRTVFFSTHIVSDVQEICDRVVFLRQGKLAYEGDVQSILNDNRRAGWRFLVPTGSNLAGIPPHTTQELGAGLSALRVSSELKDETVRALVAKGISLQGLEQEQPSLEEIFYGIKD